MRQRRGVCVVDEIYLGLSYDGTYAHSVLRWSDRRRRCDRSVNSFSKYFGMTGWRLGWLVLPESLVAPVERLAQNLYICPSTIAQHAALACFERRIDRGVRATPRRSSRDDATTCVSALASLDLPAPVEPDGAFYAYADCSRHAASSWDFCLDMMHRAQVALTPGATSAATIPERYLRLSFASAMPQLEEAMARLKSCPVTFAYRLTVRG